MLPGKDPLLQFAITDNPLSGNQHMLNTVGKLVWIRKGRTVYDGLGIK